MLIIRQSKHPIANQLPPISPSGWIPQLLGHCSSVKFKGFSKFCLRSQRLKFPSQVWCMPSFKVSDQQGAASYLVSILSESSYSFLLVDCK
ncbi:hypothetical protein M747DRAFT_292180 [Aspergillus niger ATCC 13496]|uniref:Uncharacterized protein n=1 Tax=Aspergillus niger ATCC 13496 TaxID=1353008 RepID=A0A370CGP5_ASPNG|nr:hypothetical protein M747DRAFT_292180 [Aspergillus niger ATCC 13496]